MKKLTYIYILLIVLVVSSCTKQVFSPNKIDGNSDKSSSPVWRSSDLTGTNVTGGNDADIEGTVIVDPNDPNNGNTTIDNGTGVVGGVSTGGEIVDPNDPNNN